MARFYLSEDDRAHLKNVIAEMEKRTEGEIRLVIVRRSSPLGHLPVTLWLILMVCGLLTLLSFRFELMLDFRWWWVPAMMAGAFVLAYVCARVPALQRLLTHPADVHHHVWHRAELEFYREGLGQTADKTGILLFLSLFEKRAVVLADQGIHKKLGNGQWDHVVETIVSAAKTGEWRPRLEEAIRDCGGLLATHFPATKPHSNQLPDDIVIKD